MPMSDNPSLLCREFTNLCFQSALPTSIEPSIIATYIGILPASIFSTLFFFRNWPRHSKPSCSIPLSRRPDFSVRFLIGSLGGIGGLTLHNFSGIIVIATLGSSVYQA